MAFIQPCFIRKNTPELRKTLEALGYKAGFGNINNDSIATSSITNTYSCISMSIFDNENHHINWKANGKRIDCGDNEDLFLALAALRDDNDYMQWFVSTKTRTRRLVGCFGQVIGMDGHYKEIVGYEWHRHENRDNALT